jgi:uncharacterized protein
VTTPNDTRSPIHGRPLPVSDRSMLRRIFITEEGVRSGWSALLFTVLYIAIATLTDKVLSQFMRLDAGGPLAPSLVFVEEASSLLAIFIALRIMTGMERRPILSYGYRDKQFARRLAAGAFCGILSLTFLIGILWKAHLLVFGGFSIGGTGAWKYAFAWALIALLVGIVEESLLRGYLQFTLTRALGFWWPAFLLSIAFALWNISNDGESLLGLTVVGFGGLVFCLSLWYTRSLWWAIGFHAGWDWGPSFLYGTPDSGEPASGHLLISRAMGNPLWSGGSTGPEGSLLMSLFSSRSLC